jgi:SAM-dependent methyltransferase
MSTYFDERTHYERKLAHDPATVFWGSALSAERRFAAILRHVPTRGARLIDVGCGTGDLMAAADAAGLAPRHYCGIDIVPAFIEAARARWPQSQFIVSDAAGGLPASADTDWTIANGLFGHAQAEGLWEERFRSLTAAMWTASAIGIAYTLISTNSERRNPDAHYVDTAWALSDAIKRFGPRVILDHSYLPNDMLIIVLKS